MPLAGLDPAAFLGQDWQRRPRLFRAAWPGWTNPLAPDELAGLACEAGIESRIVTRARAGWKVEHGPFAESRFARASRRPWTLLVQAVDHHVPAVAALLAPFRFLPGWRIDDVMVSYASDGGGVGPHFDQYDVFLVQGLGRRRWRIGGRCDAKTPLQPNPDLRLLAAFEAREEWLLEPGDMLYLPPGIAHDGVAAGDDCMTYSIGFRAPSRAELVAHWCDHVLGELAEDDRYADPGLAPAANPGEIAPAALARLQAMVTEALADPAAFARWFGAYSTTPKYPDIDWTPEAPIAPAELRAALGGAVPLVRNPASRFAFVRGGAGLTLFVDGDSFDCTGAAAAFAEALCARDRLVLSPALLAGDAVIELAAALLNRDAVALDTGA